MSAQRSGVSKVAVKSQGIIVSFLLLLSTVVTPVFASSAHAVSVPLAPTDATATVYGSVGKWMLRLDGQIANYGGQPYQDKTLLEPINVLIIDPNSKSALESVLKVNWDMSAAGFPARPGHSGGFKGYIDGKLYNQQPGGLINAYSDNTFLVKNNHGRLFGPARVANGGYIYSGAFSTESALFTNWQPMHTYLSSNAARDALVAKLVATGQVQSVGIVMDNDYNVQDTTTGDHDGNAAVVVLK